MTNRHIKNYVQFIFEQGLGFPPVPGEGTPVAKKEKPYKFIFLDDINDSMHLAKKYPDGTKEYNFDTYSVQITDLEDWVKKNIVSTDRNKLTDSELDLRRKNIIDIVKGDKVNISEDDSPFIEKLRHAVATDIFGSREPETSVLFTKDFLPTTEQIDVTFIKYKK